MDLNPSHILRDTMRALGFLSRLPVPAKWFVDDDGSLTNTCRAFPLAGVITSLPAIAILIVSSMLELPLLLKALLAISALIITCGALHEDGLADVADGFFGGKTKEQRLEIMKDSRIGTYGALALFINVAIRTVAIAAILQFSALAAALALMGAAAVSRGALVWHWSELESARPGGTSDRVGSPSEDAATFALTTAIAIALICALLARDLLPVLFAFILTIVITRAFKTLAADKIGGQTGDTLGASAILAELAFLTGLASGL
ncbi:MAG: adenosylcobinamide-GDP ribazoletransferase [Rhizobiaceae bacterium]